MIDHRNSVLENLLLQPFPRRRIQHFAGAKHALQIAVIDVGERCISITHQQTHCSGRRENSGNAILLDERLPIGVGSGIVQRAFKRNRGRPRNQRRVDDITVTNNPADVGRRPPHIGGLQIEQPLSHAVDVNLITAMGMDCQLRLGGRPGGSQNKGRLIRFHFHVVATVARGAREEFLPQHVPAGTQ